MTKRSGKTHAAAGSTANRPARSRTRKSKRSKPRGTAEMMNPSRAPKPSMKPPVAKTRDMLKSMCDPFSKEAMGCKYPDGASSQSLSVQSRSLYTLTCASAYAGNCFVFTAQFPYNRLANALNTGPAGTPAYWTFGSAYTQMESSSLAYTLVNADKASYRPVCAGIILRSTQNAMTAQGTVIVTKVPRCPDVGNGTTSSDWPAGVVSGESKVFPITAGLEIPIFFRPVGSNAFNFVGGNSATAGQCNYDAVVVEFTGCSANGASVFTVDYIINLEVEVSNIGFAYAQLATPSPPDQPLVRAAVSHAYQKTDSIIQGTVEKAGQMLVNKAGEYLEGLADTFLMSML